MCNPFPPISKYLKYILGKASRSPWPTPGQHRSRFRFNCEGNLSQAMQGEMEWPQLFATSRRMNPMTLATGMHLDITWISLGYVAVLRLEKGTKEHYRHYLAERERESSVCVLSPLIVMRVRVCKLKSVVNFTCLPGELVVHASTNPTKRLACDTDITGEVQ